MNDATSDTNTMNGTNGTPNGTNVTPSDAASVPAPAIPNSAPSEAAGVASTKAVTSNAAPNAAPNVFSTKATTPDGAPSTAPNTPSTKAAAPETLRLRLKVWTDPATGKRYLMPTAVIADLASGTMTAYAMSDEDTKVLKMTPIEWNALPFFYFQEDGPAPRATARTPDAVHP